MNHLTVKALLACFCATVFFLFNLSYKSSHHGVSFIDNFIKSKDIETLTSPNMKKIMNDNVVHSPAISQVFIPITTCMIYGPVYSDKKNMIDMLINQSKISALFTTIEKPVYEVYWNLGKDKITAIELFEVQKNEGPLQAEKYKLALNSDNDWVVSISKIIDDQSIAQNLVTNLSTKADKIKAGGVWQYKNTSNVYFYQTEDGNKVPTEVSAVMEKTFSIHKSKCV